MIRSVDARPWRDVGLGRAAMRLPALAEGTAVGGGAIALACAALFLVGWLRIVPATPGSSLGAAIALTGFLLPAALFEELFCRGYLLTACRDAVGTRAAVVITSVIFGALHLSNPGSTAESVLIVTLSGVFLAAIRIVYDSLFAAWAAHAAWNWVMAVPLHASVSGIPMQSPDYRTVSAGPDWITGGAWGPEGGIVAALGMVAGLAWLNARQRRAHDYKTRLGREESLHDG
jgi:membrane protease YdiL (CAAX protease family)